ncbi:MAG: Txe/YoeB family addiction module toxin [Selenomonadaceae bacterium]|nr:Txe/YoeB family addiction module toxin [Selenomonadaceae bacterium]
MPNVLFLNDALNDFMYWAHNDRKILDKIDTILNDIERNGAAKGIGKPEKLKHEEGWSRRINDEHRLIYKIKDGNIIAVKSCKGHYDDK